MSDETISSFVYEDLGLSGTLDLTFAAGGNIGLTMEGSYQTSDFQQVGANEITIACFLEGTTLLTPNGEVAVERLAVGDLVMAGGDEMRPVPIQWIGRRRLRPAAHPRPEAALPVRIAAGAFGPGTPYRDLSLSPEHAVFVEGVMIPVRCLIDGEMITQPACDGEIVYYHVELPMHDVVRAHGLPVESYLDTGNRAMFEEGGRPLLLHPDFALGMWEAAGCAPLVISGPEVEAARKMMARARRGPVSGTVRASAA